MKLTDTERAGWAVTRDRGCVLYIFKGACFGASMGAGTAIVVYLLQGPSFNWDLAVALTIGWIISSTYLASSRWRAMERSFREPVVIE